MRPPPAYSKGSHHAAVCSIRVMLKPLAPRVLPCRHPNHCPVEPCSSAANDDLEDSQQQSGQAVLRCVPQGACHTLRLHSGRCCPVSATGDLDEIGSYTLEEQFARGGFGEVWRGASRELPKLTRFAEGRGAEHFVLKRIATAKGMDVRRDGLDEKRRMTISVRTRLSSGLCLIMHVHGVRKLSVTAGVSKALAPNASSASAGTTLLCHGVTA